MSKIKAQTNVENIKEFLDFRRWVKIFFDNVRNTINGNLDFATNFRAETVSIQFTAADTDTDVKHSLGFVPNGYIIVKSNAAMDIYDGTQPFQKAKLVLRSNAVGTASLLIY